MTAEPEGPAASDGEVRRLLRQILAAAPSGLLTSDAARLLTRVLNRTVGDEQVLRAADRIGATRQVPSNRKSRDRRLFLVHTRPSAPRIAPEVRDPWTYLGNEIARLLLDPAMDVVRLRARVPDGPDRTRLRIDRLRWRKHDYVAVTSAPSHFAERDALAANGGLGPEELLHSAGFVEQAGLDQTMLMWLVRDESLAAVLGCSLVRAVEGEAEHARTTIDTCTPRELDRRLMLLTPSGRPGGSTTRHIAVSVCVLCGHPLGDPESVARGIGPECLKRLSKEDRRLLQRPTSHGRKKPPSKLANQWAVDVRRDLETDGWLASR